MPNQISVNIYNNRRGAFDAHIGRTPNRERKGDKMKEYIKQKYSTQEIEDLGKAIAVVDYLINEGVKFWPSDLKRLSQWGEQLQTIAQSAGMKGQ